MCREMIHREVWEVWEVWERTHQKMDFLTYLPFLAVKKLVDSAPLWFN